MLHPAGRSGENVKTISTIRNSGARLLNILNDILDAVALRKVRSAARAAAASEQRLPLPAPPPAEGWMHPCSHPHTAALVPRLLQGKLVVQAGKMNLQVVADDVISLCTPLAKPGVVVVNRLNPKLPPLWGDTARVVQVMYNIVGNACKFTERVRRRAARARPFPPGAWAFHRRLILHPPARARALAGGDLGGRHACGRRGCGARARHRHRHPSGQARRHLCAV